MLKRALSRRPATSPVRPRAAVVVAGLGASAVLGVGVASAADGPAAHHAQTVQAATVQTASVQTSHGTLGKSATAHGGDTSKEGHGGSHHAAHGGSHHASHATSHHAGKAAHKAHHRAHKRASDRQASGWVRPVRKYKLSAAFDQAGGMWSHKHSGQDFAVPLGTSVRAAHGGVVVKAGASGGGDGPAYGNAIVISNGHGTYSQYAHLSRIDVHIGEHVKVGERIAASGNTGNTTGPHLHFEIRHTPNYGSAVNPVTFLHHHGLHM